MLACFARKLRREGERRDGYSKAYLTAQFRKKLRIGLQVAVAKGCAKMSLSAGLPTLKKRQAATDGMLFFKPKPRKPRKPERKPRKSGIMPKGTRPKYSNSKGNKPSLIQLCNTPAPARTKPKTHDASPRPGRPSPRTFADFIAQVEL